ncbi:MAG: ADP-glyceromanno-heptose 6-epimerase [Chlamydiae bacterium]|nr:ADP-glyceromanno-heptose 6-epimerase [Chlamydiota bacterium]
MRSMKNPMIIVTGAAGMIGSGLVRYLNNLGKIDLILVDDLKKTDKWKNLVGKQFIDLISRHQIFDWLEGRQDEIDAIFHMGACSDTMATDCDYLMENNFRFSIRLAKWALKWNKRFIYASSAATYGDGSRGFSDDESGLEELHPINMYAYSKHLVDLWMKREKVLDRVVGLKYFNVFGPNEYHKGRMSSMVLKMTHIATKGDPIHLFRSNEPEKFADGEQCRDFIYLKDAVRMTVSFLDPKAKHIGGVFNIGMGEATTWNALAGALFNALNLAPKITYVDMPSELKGQYQNYTCAKMDKFYQVFPQFSKTSMKEAVSEYVQDFLIKHERW